MLIKTIMLKKKINAQYAYFYPCKQKAINYISLLSVMYNKIFNEKSLSVL